MIQEINEELDTRKVKTIHEGIDPTIYFECMCGYARDIEIKICQNCGKEN